MHRGTLKVLLLVVLCAAPARLHAQQFKLFERTVQVHGFASQGYVYTDTNNWLTMQTSGNGSGEFTDMGLNMSAALNDKVRVGAQVYARELGRLGHKVVTGRVDLNRFWNVKVEGHFMDGFGFGAYSNGYYPQVNPGGFAANTNALVMKTGFNF
jgi:hypothetical protein